jgi:hypothetical protein
MALVVAVVLRVARVMLGEVLRASGLTGGDEATRCSVDVFRRHAWVVRDQVAADVVVDVVFEYQLGQVEPDGASGGDGRADVLDGPGSSSVVAVAGGV